MPELIQSKHEKQKEGSFEPNLGVGLSLENLNATLHEQNWQLANPNAFEGLDIGVHWTAHRIVNDSRVLGDQGGQGLYLWPAGCGAEHPKSIEIMAHIDAYSTRLDVDRDQFETRKAAHPSLLVMAPFDPPSICCDQIATNGNQHPTVLWVKLVHGGNVASVNQNVANVNQNDDRVDQNDAWEKLCEALILQMYPAKALRLIAVTGTNGKTSCVHAIRQELNHLGLRTASIGTLGVLGPHDIHNDALTYLCEGMTTPDRLTLQKILHRLDSMGFAWAALEVSSHALAQGRLGSLKFDGAIFTNLTSDHLDFHGDILSYAQAKARLFAYHLKSDACVVINAHDEWSDLMLKACERLDPTHICTYGMGPRPQHMDDAARYAQASQKELDALMNAGVNVGFQQENLWAVANLLGMMNEHGSLITQAFDSISCLIRMAKKGSAPGRMEMVRTLNGARVYIDYAHTPDALRRALDSINQCMREAEISGTQEGNIKDERRQGNVHVVFGCGGDRDASKRPMMGAIAAQHADWVYVCDDNPRSEPAESIRAQIVLGFDGVPTPRARRVSFANAKGRADQESIPAESILAEGDRRFAIHAAMERLWPNDVLLIAGKGHERKQIIGHESFEFSDHDVALGFDPWALQRDNLWCSTDARGMSRTSDEHSWLGALCGATCEAPHNLKLSIIHAVSIDTREIAANTGHVAFVAMQGSKQHGVDALAACLTQPIGNANGLVRSNATDVAAVITDKAWPDDEPAFEVVNVENTHHALNHWAKIAGERTDAWRIAITGSVGKTTTRGLVQGMLSSLMHPPVTPSHKIDAHNTHSSRHRVHASEKSYNNHIGVPLSMIRMPRHASIGVFEVGMNNPGEILPLAQLVRPHCAIITQLAPAHVGRMGGMDAIAKEKASIIGGLMMHGWLVHIEGPYSWIVEKTARDKSVQIVRIKPRTSIGSHPHDIQDKSDCAHEVHWWMEEGRIGFSLRMPATTLLGHPTLQLWAASPNHVSEGWAMNAALAVGTGWAYSIQHDPSIDMDRLRVVLQGGCDHMAQVPVEKGRGVITAIATLSQVHKAKGHDVIWFWDETYNANSQSLINAIKAMGNWRLPHVKQPSDTPTRIAVIGDMFEQGVFLDQYLDEVATCIMDQARRGLLSHVIACGTQGSMLASKLVFDGVQALVPDVVVCVNQEQVVDQIARMLDQAPASRPLLIMAKAGRSAGLDTLRANLQQFFVLNHSHPMASL